MAVRGNIRSLESLRIRILALQQAGFKRELGSVLGVAAMKQVADQFRASRDPYGVPWKPLKHRRGQPLRDTGRLQAGFSPANVTANDLGFRLHVPVAYASHHQFGAPRAHIDPRPMLPTNARGMPPRWAEAFDREAGKLIRRALGKAN